jgi:hypothetical protein
MARPVVHASCFQLMSFQSQPCGPGSRGIRIELEFREAGVCTLAFAVAGELLGRFVVLGTAVRSIGI